MGCSASSLQTNVKGQTVQEINYLKTNLKVDNEDLKIIMKAFKKINIHKDGVVAFDEFCARIRREPDNFLESVFSFFSSSDSSCSRLTVGLTFAEFVLFCCFFLTLDERGFTEYLFMILTDGDYNRSLLNKNDTFKIVNLQENIHHCFGDAWGKSERQRQTVTWVMDHGQDNLKHDGVITKEEFFSACDRNKSLLFPAYSCQIDIRAKVVNKQFWKSMRGLGNRLLKRDIKAIRDALHKLTGATQYHDNVDRHHRSEFQTERLVASIVEDKDKADEQRFAMNAGSKHTAPPPPLAPPGRRHGHALSANAPATPPPPPPEPRHIRQNKEHTKEHSAMVEERRYQQAHMHEAHKPHFPPRRDGQKKRTTRHRSGSSGSQSGDESTGGIDIEFD